MKYTSLVVCVLLVGCQTSNRQANCKCDHMTAETLQTQIDSKEKISTKYMTTSEKLSLAAELLNNDAPEQALDVLETIPQDERMSQYKKLKRDAINKAVVNLRYKVRALYEKSLQQTGDIKRESLLQSKVILEDIIKSFPEYNDMYSIKNNLKQINRELAKSS